MADLTHQSFMQRAIRLAKMGAKTTTPNPNVGCVVVKEDSIVGQGYHQKTGGPHAEVVALDHAQDSSKNATLYVTLEPCCHQGRTGPCTQRIIDSGVKCVYIAMLDPNPKVAGKGVQALELAGIKTHVGLLQSEAQALNPGFIIRMTHKRPKVTLKLGASLDGKIAMASGESQWITSPEARTRVHELRSTASAVLTGTGTVRTDDPSLTVRHVETTRQPVRVVLDTQNTTPQASALFQDGDETWLFTSVARPELPSSVQQVRIDTHANAGLDLHQVLLELGRREINDVLIEAGPTLSGAFLEAGLVDELHVFMAPDILGSQTQSMVYTDNILSLADKLRFEFVSAEPIGRDLHLQLKRASCLPE